MNITWDNAELVHLLWAAIAVVALLTWLDFSRREVLGRFVSAVMQHRLAERASTERRVAKHALVLGVFVLGILAMMRPQTEGGTETTGASRASADIIVVMDVSRSMLAEDAAPYRLARAKAEVAGLLGKLDGHRVGLVAFAGRAALLSPLTPDYDFFRMALRGLDVNSVTRGGTKIGVALRTAIDAFEPGPGSKLIVLITDGEDHDSYALEVAKEARDAGIRIVSVGFGSEEGSQITLIDPETGGREVLMYQGQPVISRLNGQLLRDLALTTEGAYVPAGTAALDLESIVDEHIEPIVRDTGDIARPTPNEQYPWFVLGALVCLVAAVWIGSTTGRREV